MRKWGVAASFSTIFGLIICSHLDFFVVLAYMGTFGVLAGMVYDH